MDCVPSDDPRLKRMEDLVHDLSTALEESSRSVTTRRRWGMRRRARSTGNLPESVGLAGSEASSDHATDSDEPPRRPVHTFSLAARNLHGNLESDSLNENFSPVHPNTRRKRKLKRTEASAEGASTSALALAPTAGAAASAKKKRGLRLANNADNGVGGPACGKRKRSLRERSLEPGGGCLRSVCTAPREHRDLMDCTDNLEENNACEMASSSSISSSDSDNGIYTNDEGQEGDDEQSDWIGDGGGGGGRPWWEEADAEPDTDKEDETLQKLLNCHVNDDAFRQVFRTPRGSREIRSGRRRVGGERPGFSIVTSANEKLSRFLQDPGQTRLRLHPMQRGERDQLCHLAQLYSLELSLSRGARPVLTKTQRTLRAEPAAGARLRPLHADTKRRRGLLAPPTFCPAGNPAVAAASTSRPMNWEPGPGHAGVVLRHKHGHGYKSS